MRTQSVVQKITATLLIAGLWAGVAHWLDGRESLASLTWRKALATARKLALRQDETMIGAEMRRRHV